MRAVCGLAVLSSRSKLSIGWQKFILTEIKKSYEKISSFVARVAGKHLFEQAGWIVELSSVCSKTPQSLQDLKIFWSSG